MLLLIRQVAEDGFPLGGGECCIQHLLVYLPTRYIDRTT